MAGHQIFALTCSASSHAKLKAMGATPVDAYLESSTPPALPAIDAVAHAAARFCFSGPSRAFLTNVDGTAAFLNAAETAGARTFVYISAAGIIMDDAGSSIRNADPPSRTISRVERRSGSRP